MKIVTIEEFEKELCNFLKGIKVSFKGNGELLNVFGKEVLHFKEGMCVCVESQFKKKVMDLCDS